DLDVPRGGDGADQPGRPVRHPEASIVPARRLQQPQTRYHSVHTVYLVILRVSAVLTGRNARIHRRLLRYRRRRSQGVAGEGCEMTRDNVLIVHWHDLGRYLGVYDPPDVSSPRLDQLAAEGILFTRAHATAPLCSPSRGSLFTGRYPQSNGLIGLAHHGWEYRAGVRTLPHILSESGWHSVLFGMQHETSHPSRLGFDDFDVS